MHPVVFLICFIPAAVILLASLVLMVQFSLSYNNAGRADVFHKFILVFFKVFCGPNIVYKSCCFHIFNQFIYVYSLLERYTRTDFKINTEIARDLNITPVLDNILDYRRNWI